MKKAMAILGIALLVAAIASVASDPVPIEQKLISIQAREALPGFDGIGDEPVDVQAAILDLGDEPLLLLKAQAALMAHPDMARAVFRFMRPSRNSRRCCAPMEKTPCRRFTTSFASPSAPLNG